MTEDTLLPDCRKVLGIFYQQYHYLLWDNNIFIMQKKELIKTVISVKSVFNVYVWLHIYLFIRYQCLHMCCLRPVEFNTEFIA